MGIYSNRLNQESVCVPTLFVWVIVFWMHIFPLCDNNGGKRNCICKTICLFLLLWLYKCITVWDSQIQVSMQLQQIRIGLLQLEKQQHCALVQLAYLSRLTPNNPNLHGCRLQSSHIFLLCKLKYCLIFLQKELWVLGKEHGVHKCSKICT